MAHTFSCSADAPLVHTTGGSVRGYRFDGLDIFKGIPYAKARRFHAPKPAVWDGVLDATSYGYVCPLLEMPKPNGEMLVPHRYWLMDEACQNLNIWTPALDDAHRPVLVWLHGGGYFAGSSIEQIAYEGENMARLGDCVVVSINHRLNILGYLDLSDFGAEYANSGNAGGDDIIAALRWVRDNIAAFGGDPGNVTVFGQSGGGAKVTTLLQTPAADGLFHKGIVMSGVLGRLADCTGSGRDCAEALMAELGAADIAALETIPYAALAAAYNKVAPALKAAGKNTGCAPHAFYLGDPLENAFRPETARIPLLVGTVFGEFAAFNGFGLNKAQMSAAEAEGFAEKMLGKQTAYFSQVDEPVILVFWGDHYNPIDSNYDVYTTTGYASDSSADPRLHQTTLLMWSNYTDRPVDLGTIAAYDISPVMMNLYGLEQPLYFQLLNRQLQVADRANTRGTVMNLDGTTTQTPSSLQESWSQKHWLLQYDLMFGKGYALSRMGMESLNSTQTDE